MKHLHFFLTAIFLSLNLTAQNQKPDFQLNQFYPKWGAKNIESPTDIQASAKVYSDGEKIHIEVDVVDDMLVNNADVLHTDHVEVWFGLPIYDLVDFSAPFTGNEEEDLEVKKQWIHSKLPAKYYCFNSQGESDNWLGLPISKVNIYDEIPYYYYDETWCKKGEDVEQLNCSNCTKIYAMNDFMGISHFGLFLDNRSTYLYDRENYFLFEQATGYKLGDLSLGCTYTAKPTATGYKVKVAFDAKALGFVILPEMSEVKLMIDVIDVDDDGKQETLLSSSSKRKWGNLTTFNNVKFQKALRTNFSNIPSRFLRKIKQSYPQFKVLGNERWNSFTFDIGKAKCWDVEDTAKVCVNWRSAYSYLPTFLSIQQKNLGGLQLDLIHFQNYNMTSYEAYYYNVPTFMDGGYYTAHYIENYDMSTISYKRHIGKNSEILNDKNWESNLLKVWETRDLLKEFLFPDGNLGIASYDVYGGNSSGVCGGCLRYELEIDRLNNKKLERVIKIGDNTLLHNNHVSITDSDCTYEYKVIIEEIIWKEVGKVLKIKTGSFEENRQPIEAIYITFNDNGTVQEIYPLPEKE